MLAKVKNQTLKKCPGDKKELTHQSIMFSEAVKVNLLTHRTCSYSQIKGYKCVCVCFSHTKQLDVYFSLYYIANGGVLTKETQPQWQRNQYNF